MELILQEQLLLPELLLVRQLLQERQQQQEPVQLLRPTTVVSPMAALAVELPQVAEEPSSTISLFDWNSTQTAGELFGQSADAEAGLRLVEFLKHTDIRGLLQFYLV